MGAGQRPGTWSRESDGAGYGWRNIQGITSWSLDATMIDFSSWTAFDQSTVSANNTYQYDYTNFPGFVYEGYGFFPDPPIYSSGTNNYNGTSFTYTLSAYRDSDNAIYLDNLGLWGVPTDSTELVYRFETGSRDGANTDRWVTGYQSGYTMVTFSSPPYPAPTGALNVAATAPTGRAINIDWSVSP